MRAWYTAPTCMITDHRKLKVTQTMPTINLENVVRRFHVDHSDTWVNAVDHISLSIKDGDTLALLGPSGSGKTTLLRLIAGLEQADAGEVFFDEVPLRDMPREDRGIGMVFQNYALIPQWEAERNISFFLRLRRREHEVPDRVRQVSQITGVDIDQLMAKRPSQLSGGEKQRVAIARAFARDLELLLLDEPFANLDAKFRAQARLQVGRLLQQYPVTTILVTHDQQEAAALAERIILMRAGRIEQIGNFNSLYEDPANLFVAEFIGVPTINLFAGDVQDGRWHGDLFGGYPLPVDLPDGYDVTLGLRAEYLHLSDESSFSGKVIDLAYFYAERYIILDVQSSKQPDVMWQMQVPLDTKIEKGEIVHASFDPAHALFFDSASGERLV